MPDELDLSAKANVCYSNYIGAQQQRGWQVPGIVRWMANFTNLLTVRVRTRKEIACKAALHPPIFTLPAQADQGCRKVCEVWDWTGCQLRHTCSCCGLAAPRQGGIIQGGGTRWIGQVPRLRYCVRRKRLRGSPWHEVNREVQRHRRPGIAAAVGGQNLPRVFYVRCLAHSCVCD